MLPISRWVLAAVTAGVQTFLVTNLSYSEFLVGSLLQVTNGGVLTMTNDFSGLLIANPLFIDTGGVFNGQGENLPGPSWSSPMAA